jgi:DeoR/GlpR family transcriptional regulator of sugar metabolism
MSGSRLKRDELVEAVFARFWSAARENGRPEIAGISLELDELRDEIARQTGVPRQNNKWIVTQLRSYEKSHSVRLFSFHRNAGGAECVRAADKMVSFVQKKHLYRPEKIRLATALADLIATDYADSQEQVRIFLGAGTTLTLAAEIIRNRAGELNAPVQIITHNAGILQVLILPETSKHLTVTVPRGTFDPVTYVFLPDDLSGFHLEETDLVVQGTSAVCEGVLYVESETEARVKQRILGQTTGLSVLVLTLHEFLRSVPPTMHRYGEIRDYDLVILPRMNRPSVDQQEAQQWIAANLRHYTVKVRHWHYEILLRTQPHQ